MSNEQQKAQDTNFLMYTIGVASAAFFSVLGYTWVAYV